MCDGLGLETYNFQQKAYVRNWEVLIKDAMLVPSYIAGVLLQTINALNLLCDMYENAELSDFNPTGRIVDDVLDSAVHYHHQNAK